MYQQLPCLHCRLEWEQLLEQHRTLQDSFDQLQAEARFEADQARQQLQDRQQEIDQLKAQLMVSGLKLNQTYMAIFMFGSQREFLEDYFCISSQCFVLYLAINFEFPHNTLHFLAIIICLLLLRCSQCNALVWISSINLF